MGKGKWTASNGNTVSISPFTSDNGFKFITLDCEETLGGSLANGTIEFVHDGGDTATKMITDQETVDIELGTTELGTMLTIHGIIVNRSYNHNHFGISFICAPDKEFYTRRSYFTYDDIDSAIDSLWKGNKEIRTKSDLAGGIKLNQAGDYDMAFLKQLCESYKKDTIYAFGLGGLLLKDLVGIDSTGNQEPYWTLVGDGDHVIQSSGQPGEEDSRFQLFYDYTLYMKPENLWIDMENRSKNLSAIIFDDMYKLVHRDFDILRENSYYNKRIYNSRMYNQLQVSQTSELLVYRLGDVIKYFRPVEQETVPFKVYIISKIKYHYRTEPSSRGAGKKEFPFKLEYTLHCLEERGVIMNDQDPKDLA